LLRLPVMVFQKCMVRVSATWMIFENKALAKRSAASLWRRATTAGILSPLIIHCLDQRLGLWKKGIWQHCRVNALTTKQRRTSKNINIISILF
jgi:hypothetical protein